VGVDQKDEIGETPLTFAAVARKPEAVRMLIDPKSGVFARNKDGEATIVSRVTSLHGIRSSSGHVM
jgi:hypothetical protein